MWGVCRDVVEATTPGLLACHDSMASQLKAVSPERPLARVQATVDEPGAGHLEPHGAVRAGERALVGVRPHVHVQLPAAVAAVVAVQALQRAWRIVAAHVAAAVARPASGSCTSVPGVTDRLSTQSVDP